ncbi:HNH endonuclease [Sinorhizobium psoraleae]|uniref:HNH endonuclease n=1 Tax=Sinorhizobium psoraleae TaxID=520838 RepID=A0ABT4KRT5_9HYPH|nr:HNH endonuclease [Sinorhizobium psoraleae]
MKSSIQKLRRKAAKSQGGQSFYCQQPMWETDPKIFSERFRVPARAVFLFQCTAEHLVARCDGGRDTKENIVAACLYCNKIATGRSGQKMPYPKETCPITDEAGSVAP